MCLLSYLLAYATFLILFSEWRQRRIFTGAPDPDEGDFFAFGFDQVSEELVDCVVLVRKYKNWRPT